VEWSKRTDWSTPGLTLARRGLCQVSWEPVCAGRSPLHQEGEEDEDELTLERATLNVAVNTDGLLDCFVTDQGPPVRSDSTLPTLPTASPRTGREGHLQHTTPSSLGPKEWRWREGRRASSGI